MNREDVQLRTGDKIKLRNGEQGEVFLVTRIEAFSAGRWFTLGGFYPESSRLDVVEVNGARVIG